MAAVQRAETIRMRLLVLGTLALLQIPSSKALAAPPQHPLGSTSAKALALSLSDVTHSFGAHWRTVFARTISNAEVRSVTNIPGFSGASAVVKDRITGYLTGFNRVGAVSYQAGKLVTTPGAVSVSSYVNIYKSDKGPREALILSHKYKIKKIAGLTYQIAPFSGVGDEAVVETVTFKVSKQFPTTHGVSIFFRRGRYLGLDSVSWYGKPSTSDAVRLAKLIDGRFQAAG